MNLRRGLFIFMLLSLGVSFLVVRQSLTPEALHVIFDLDWSIAAWIVPAILAAWCCDAGRFLMVSKAMGYRISLWRGLALTWLNYFGSAITPLQVGGGPFQVYVLYAQDQIPVGSGMAITMLRTLMSTFMLSLLAPSALWLAPELLARYGLARGIYLLSVSGAMVHRAIICLSPALDPESGRVFCLAAQTVSSVEKTPCPVDLSSSGSGDDEL